MRLFNNAASTVKVSSDKNVNLHHHTVKEYGPCGSKAPHILGFSMRQVCDQPHTSAYFPVGERAIVFIG